MFPACVVYKSEGDRISPTVLQKLFFQGKYRYSQVFQTDYATSQSQGHYRIGVVATREANRSIKCVLEKQARQQSAKKWK